MMTSRTKAAKLCRERELLTEESKLVVASQPDLRKVGEVQLGGSLGGNCQIANSPFDLQENDPPSIRELKLKYWKIDADSKRIAADLAAEERRFAIDCIVRGRYGNLLPDMEKFGDDLQLYFNSFERACLLLKAEKSIYCDLLTTRLTVKAAGIYASLSVEQKQDYDCVKTAILCNYHKSDM